MSKHPSKGKRQFDYSLATYPIGYHKYVVSPKKICLQFKDVQCKTRAPESKEGLKRTSWGTHEMPIDTKGTDINVLAVGIPLDLYEEVLNNLLEAFIEHDKKYKENSKKEMLIKFAKRILEKLNVK